MSIIITNDEINLLCGLDIDNLGDQERIIKIAMEPSVFDTREEYVKGMKLVLEEVPFFQNPR